MLTVHAQNALIDFIRTRAQSYVLKLVVSVPHGVIQMVPVLPVTQVTGLQ